MTTELFIVGLRKWLEPFGFAETYRAPECRPCDADEVHFAKDGIRLVCERVRDSITMRVMFEVVRPVKPGSNRVIVLSVRTNHYLLCEDKKGLISLHEGADLDEILSHVSDARRSLKKINKTKRCKAKTTQ